MSEQAPTKDQSKLDEKGRCCGRKPIFYKGGSWRSPLTTPMHFCCECHREFGPDGRQRQNWAWKEVSPGTFAQHESLGAAVARVTS